MVDKEKDSFIDSLLFILIPVGIPTAGLIFLIYHLIK